MKCIYLAPNTDGTAEMAITKVNLTGRQSVEAVRISKGDTGFCTNNEILNLLSLSRAICYVNECPYLQKNETTGFARVRIFNGQRRK